MLNKAILGVIASGRPVAVGPCDPYYDDVLHHFRMAGASGSSVFVDEKGYSVANTGTPSQSNAVTKFLPTAGYFDGNADSFGAALSPSFTGFDFCWEGWFYFLSLKTNALIDKRTALAVQGLSLFMENISGYRIHFTAGRSGQGSWDTFLTSATVVTDTWYHIAATREGNVYRLFIDGVLEDSNTDSNVPSTGESTFRVASFVTTPSLCLHGYASDVRITRGAARYTSSFTPPSAAFPTYQC